ncbi:hypothetical protein DJ568_14805 [Mucilaginibacter hurinus]|uniref:Uncharacterized protein n=1 Tax=Mucilaginibacter hurinus TaxID=2201324 RepID=A0A367GMQ0_9SPHI|nr:hypothetical protein [Mucilaginibacter hurinus]RCH54146.1 hypothetical protein DJ568_14805 [Mucilaginibacter hurinus]
MEDIINFRIFLSFPLFGLFIPNLGLFLTGASASALPVTHIIIGCTLLTCIAVLSIGIMMYKKKHGITNDHENNTPILDL